MLHHKPVKFIQLILFVFVEAASEGTFPEPFLVSDNPVHGITPCLEDSPL
jgi:hypothetical protein